MLAQAVFPDLGQQSRDNISFLLPKIPSTSTELHFDESTTWYRLADEMFLHLEGTTVLGVQCSALFRKPQKRAIGTSMCMTKNMTGHAHLLKLSYIQINSSTNSPDPFCSSSGP